MISTRKLVDSYEEQAILEEMIDGAKPEVRPEMTGLHYLLSTPFRYPPLRHGSRFGRRSEPSLWYGSTRPRTAFAETAYYRLLFLEGTTAPLSPIDVELSLFHVPIRTDHGIDLRQPPFAEHRAAIASPTDYDASQRLGTEMREDGVEAFRYPSARDPTGVNVALFTPKPFRASLPSVPETWHCVATPLRVEFTRKDFFQRHGLAFPRSRFEVDGVLPSPAP